MAKKKTETNPETAAPMNTGAQGLSVSPTVIGPKFNPHIRPVGGPGEQVSTTPIRQSYESIQENAKGPGVEEWRRTDQTSP